MIHCLLSLLPPAAPPLLRLPGDADPDGGALALQRFLAGEGESCSARETEL